jgi:hypothetical protein
MTNEELKQAKVIMDILKYDIKTDEYGTRRYFQHGELHRDDGPAIEFADGEKHYYQHGERHRDDGPAIEDADGNKFYYQHGELHRDDGPAITWADGDKSWWLNDVKVVPF